MRQLLKRVRECRLAQLGARLRRLAVDQKNVGKAGRGFQLG